MFLHTLFLENEANLSGKNTGHWYWKWKLIEISYSCDVSNQYNYYFLVKMLATLFAKNYFGNYSLGFVKKSIVSKLDKTLVSLYVFSNQSGSSNSL